MKTIRHFFLGDDDNPGVLLLAYALLVPFVVLYGVIRLALWFDAILTK